MDTELVEKWPKVVIVQSEGKVAGWHLASLVCVCVRATPCWPVWVAGYGDVRLSVVAMSMLTPACFTDSWRMMGFCSSFLDLVYMIIVWELWIFFFVLVIVSLFCSSLFFFLVFLVSLGFFVLFSFCCLSVFHSSYISFCLVFLPVTSKQIKKNLYGWMAKKLKNRTAHTLFHTLHT